ncbi:DMT family transporter [Pseudobdellovibrio exovorus]|uniref:EamA domain-containing protein n=1 Tax=Pseudobdellovibrio exovorus JSS TaxID=1184267 RepID=M4VA25_9BACT|nr:DMT family transporter [Pseudobdellovibrio exovorus]AGH96053.1 hypothetical protein A11Q_1837 [Pseudobdellovibrio exovorus JSS]
MGFIFIILGTLMWSFDTLIRYPLLASLRPDTMVFLEHALLTIIFVPLLFKTKSFFRQMNVRHLTSFLVIGVMGSAVSTLAFTQAFALINPSLVILLQKLQPIVVILLSVFILKEKFSRRFFALSALALIGVFLISYPDISPLWMTTNSPIFQTGSHALLGYGLTLLAVIGWGASTVFGKKLSTEGFNENEIMAGRFSLGFLFLLVFCLSQSSLPTTEISYDVYLKVAAMVLLSGLLGMSLYYRGLSRLPAHISAIAEMFFPLSAVMINWIFLGKALLPIQIAGAIVLTASSIGIQLSRRHTN